MNRTFRVTSSVFASTCAVITLAAFQEACTGALLTPDPMGDASVRDAPVPDAPVGDAPMHHAPVADAPVEDAPVGDGGFCPADVDADLASNGNGPGQVAASGSAEGDSVDCTFCEVGVSVATSSNATLQPGVTDPDVTTLYIAPSISKPAPSCSAPSDASNVWFAGQIVIGAAKPGVYHGPSTSPLAYCDGLTVSYDLPNDTGTVDCGDSGYFVGPASCPAGCISLCTAGGEDGGDGGEICSPCESGGQSQTETMTYGLEDGCQDVIENLGSWTVTLTSVVPAVVPADAGLAPGVVIYTVHGSLTATLFHDENAPSPSVTVTLTF
jgi:hypothetical protein